VEYMLLIYGDEADFADMPDDEKQAMYRAYFALARDLKAQGKMRGSGELHSVATATTVQVQDGELLVTDGPFAETKDVLGGYFLVEAESLDEAIEWAARIPRAERGKIEVRPLVDHGNGA
jgi:hypothetical protein